MIENIRVLIDFGLVVLVWVVQFAIYPGFKYFEDKNLKRWHSQYSRGISYVVAPLMLSQLAISFYLSFFQFSWCSLVYFLLVLITWGTTFFWAIPLHSAIDEKDEPFKEVGKLVKVNLIRAWIWTIIFTFSFGLQVFTRISL